MKSLSLKVMTLLMAALILSASGCINDEMSSPEGTAKGYFRALNKYDFQKMLTYVEPRATTEEHMKDAAAITRVMRARATPYGLTIHKVILVSKEDSLVWMGDKWGHSERATVEIYAWKNHFKDAYSKFTNKLVLLNNVWYIEEREIRPLLNRGRLARSGEWPKR